MGDLARTMSHEQVHSVPKTILKLNSWNTVICMKLFNFTILKMALHIGF